MVFVHDSFRWKIVLHHILSHIQTLCRLVGFIWPLFIVQQDCDNLAWDHLSVDVEQGTKIDMFFSETGNYLCEQQL